MNICPIQTHDTFAQKPLRVCILGASGSIGKQTLDVCRKHKDKIEVVGLSVYSSCDALVQAAKEFNVKHLVVADVSHKNDPVLDELADDVELGFGAEAIVELCQQDDCDCVVVAVVGAAGLRASLATITTGKRLALANKESLVVAGDLLMPLAKPSQLLPVDSEHSAIFQCLAGEAHADIYKIWLTCSGGPFFGMTQRELENVCAADALKHPTWLMGPKITIDCATLMNKGLEVLEAHQLFDVDIDNINVLIHPQSRIHSAVEFYDGSVKAQIGPSDMRLPIQYALSYPERWETPAKRQDYRTSCDFSFAAADTKSFPCLALALQAGKLGGIMPCVLNAANEIANKAFRENRCGFNDIALLIEKTLECFDPVAVESIEQLEEYDFKAREITTKLLED